MIRKGLKKFLGMDEDEQQVNKKNQQQDYSEPMVQTNEENINDYYDESNDFTEVQSTNMNEKTQLVIRSPKNFEQAQETARCIIAKNPVFLDLKAIDNEMTTRILDFLSGVIFTLEGDIRQMAPRMYLLTPPNVNVDGLEGLISDEG